MRRREFTLHLAAASLSLSGAARAQGAPVEGTHFIRLQQPVPVAVTPGKFEVIEFFGYWCPHCNALERTLEAWAKQLPADVVLRRMPVAFNAAHEPYQRIYFALETMGLVETMHRKVFSAIHGQQKRLDKEPEIVAFMVANDVDGAKFSDAYKSFTVQTRVRQAKQLVEAYRVDSVPMMSVNGRYTTSASSAGSNEAALQVVDYLVLRARKTG